MPSSCFLTQRIIHFHLSLNSSCSRFRLSHRVQPDMSTNPGRKVTMRFHMVLSTRTPESTTSDRTTGDRVLATYDSEDFWLEKQKLIAKCI